jgi:hypothetical protein
MFFKPRYSKQFETLIEQELGIRKLFKHKDIIELVTGEKIRLAEGPNTIMRSEKKYHLLADPITNILLEVKEGKIVKIEKYDTLINENQIRHQEWFILQNGSVSTTTNLQGDLLHSYSEFFIPGKNSSHYTDTTIDSLGQSFTEWGELTR